jgi:hypothetical protein
MDATLCRGIEQFLHSETIKLLFAVAQIAIARLIALDEIAAQITSEDGTEILHGNGGGR